MTFGKSYPIWNQINSCSYTSGKSYGVKTDGDVNVLVGTSSSNSYEFVTHTTTHRILDNGDREYRFYVDGKCIKRALLPKGGDKLKKLSVSEVNKR